MFGQCYIALRFSQVHFAQVPLTDLVTAEGFLLLCVCPALLVELAVAYQCSLSAAFQSQTPSPGIHSCCIARSVTELKPLKSIFLVRA